MNREHGAIIVGCLLALAFALTVHSRKALPSAQAEIVADEPTMDGQLQQSSIAACMLAGHAVQFDEEARPISCRTKPF